MVIPSISALLAFALSGASMFLPERNVSSRSIDRRESSGDAEKITKAAEKRERKAALRRASLARVKHG